MSTPRKRETAEERDERIVAEAGFWKASWQGAQVVEDGLCDDAKLDEAHRSAVRILNRIVKRRRK